MREREKERKEREIKKIKNSFKHRNMRVAEKRKKEEQTKIP